MKRLPATMLGCLMVLASAVPAGADLTGDEATFQRIGVLGGPFPSVFEDATFSVGPPIEYSNSVLTFDLTANGVVITALADTAFSASSLHIWRFYLPDRILGVVSVDNVDFGGLGPADVTFSEHVLTINISDLDPGPEGVLSITLELEDCATLPIAAVPAVSVRGLIALAFGLALGAFLLLRRPS
jgi:hypothetical protein